MKPLLNIFLKTQQTFESVEEKISSKELNLILLFCSVSLALQGVLRDFADGQKVPIGSGILFLTVTTALIFLVFKYAYPWLFWKISKLFEGKATLKQTRLVVALALLPSLIILVISVLLIVIAIFYHNQEIVSYRSSVTFLVVALLSFRIAVIGLSYFNRYSYLYGLIVLLIPAGLIQLVYFAISNL